MKEPLCISSFLYPLAESIQPILSPVFQVINLLPLFLGQIKSYISFVKVLLTQSSYLHSLRLAVCLGKLHTIGSDSHGVEHLGTSQHIFIHVKIILPSNLSTIYTYLKGLQEYETGKCFPKDRKVVQN